MLFCPSKIDFIPYLSISLIIDFDKEFSDDCLSGSVSHPEEPVSGTIVMDAKDDEAAQRLAAYKEYLTDEMPRMHQRSAFAAFWAENFEMFGVHKYDSEYNIDDSTDSLEPSEEEQNADASTFQEEGNTCDLETNCPLDKEVAHGGQGTMSAGRTCSSGDASRSRASSSRRTRRLGLFSSRRAARQFDLLDADDELTDE